MGSPFLPVVGTVTIFVSETLATLQRILDIFLVNVISHDLRTLQLLISCASVSYQTFTLTTPNTLQCIQYEYTL